jgi:hypothetical protein
MFKYPPKWAINKKKQKKQKRKKVPASLAIVVFVSLAINGNL